MNIHTTSIIEEGAQIGKNVTIGPFAYIGKNVCLEDGVEIKSHNVIDGYTVVGQNTIIYPFCSIGNTPQDLKYKGEKSYVEIGQNNVIREYCTIHPGNGEGKKTIIGNNCLLMIGTHIAHDCVVGSSVIFANNATLAGHVFVEDFAFFGGLSAVHQFVRIGRHAMIGGLAAVTRDVIPYATVSSPRSSIDGINLVGMRRRNYSRDEIMATQKAVEALFSKENILLENINYVEKEYGNYDSVKHIIEFMKNDTRRSYTQTR